MASDVVFRPDTSFPYLAFAVKHGLDYAWVLQVSDRLISGETVYSNAVGMRGLEMRELCVVICAESDRRRQVVGVEAAFTTREIDAGGIRDYWADSAQWLLFPALPAHKLPASASLSPLR